MTDYIDVASGLRIAASEARVAANTAHFEGNHDAAAMARTLAAEFIRYAERYENKTGVTA